MTEAILSDDETGNTRHTEGEVVFRTTTILEFMINEYKPGVMARYAAGPNGPGIIVFPSSHISVRSPIRDTGWHMVHLTIHNGREPGKYYGFAVPVEDPRVIDEVIVNLQKQQDKLHR